MFNEASSAAEVGEVAYANVASGSESSDSLTKVSTAIVLGGVAIASKYAEAKGLDNDMPTLAHMAVDSGAHPAVGFMGAWAADGSSRSFIRRSAGIAKTRLALLGATVANFGVEIGQSLSVASPDYSNFLAPQRLPETGKDYMFALAGMGLYLLQRRRHERGSSS